MTYGADIGGILGGLASLLILYAALRKWIRKQRAQHSDPGGPHIFFDVARERTDTSPVHATSTLDALASDPVQLQACARRIASDLLADFGHIETTLLKPDGKILSARLDRVARENIELWMRAAGLPVHE